MTNLKNIKLLDITERGIKRFREAKNVVISINEMSKTISHNYCKIIYNLLGNYGSV